MIIVVYGNPAPQGSKRFLGTTKLGRGIMAENSPGVASWRSDVATAARAAMDRERARLKGELERIGATGELQPFTEAVVARMVFSFQRPASIKRGKRPFMTVAPDLSKLARSTEDALQASGVIRNDGLIVEYTRLAKVYCGEDPEALETPGAYIQLGALVDSEAIEGPVGGKKGWANRQG